MTDRFSRRLPRLTKHNHPDFLDRAIKQWSDADRDEQIRRELREFTEHFGISI